MKWVSGCIVQPQVKSRFEFLSLRLYPYIVGVGQRTVQSDKAHPYPFFPPKYWTFFILFSSTTSLCSTAWFSASWKSWFYLLHRLESLMTCWQVLEMMGLESWQVTHAYGCLLWLYIANSLGLFMVVALSRRSMSSKQGSQSHRENYYSLCDQLRYLHFKKQVWWWAYWTSEAQYNAF